MTSDKTRQLIKDTIESAISQLTTEYRGSSLTDIFITVEPDCGVLSIFDDEENKVAEIILDEWKNCNDMSDEDISPILLGIVSQLDSEDAFAPLEKYYPFSVCYADENLEVIEELLTIAGNDDFLIGNNVVSDFGKQFDNFLNKLLKS